MVVVRHFFRVRNRRGDDNYGESVAIGYGCQIVGDQEPSPALHQRVLSDHQGRAQWSSRQFGAPEQYGVAPGLGRRRGVMPLRAQGYLFRQGGRPAPRESLGRMLVFTAQAVC